jgi:AraC-like DNA-binding protein
MIAGCLLSQGTPECASDPCGQLALRSRAKSVILQNIGSARLDPARISELSGIKRSTLYRVFAAEGGVSAFVQDLRLNLVNSDLQDPACGLDRIAALAERRGFHNASSFNRAFRSKFGRTPGDVRAAALERSSDGQPPADPD